MTRDELVAWCRRAPDRGKVKHEEFIDYITLIERRQRAGNRWETRAVPYMSVDGRLAMANVDHERQDRRLSFHDPVVLADTDQHLTIMVIVESEIYGRRHGIATSRKADGSSIETQHPWEIAETSAIGRALAAMGYGLLPGSGLNSADDVSRGVTDTAGRETGATASLSPRQRDFLISAAADALGLSRPESAQYVNRLCRERFGHSLRECTTEEGRSLVQEFRRDRSEPEADKGGEEPVPAPVGG